MKILMLTPYLPYPPASGGQIRTLNLLKYLSKNNEITLVSLYKKKEEIKNVAYLKKYCKHVYACKRAEKPWQIKIILETLLTFNPLLIVRNFSHEAQQLLAELTGKEKFDVIHAETFYIMPHISVTDIPILLVEQTIEYQVYQHFVSSLPFFIRPIFYLDIIKLKYWEQYYWKKANVVAAVSEADQKLIKKVEPTIKPVIVPNGAGDEMLANCLKEKSFTNHVFLFLGNYYWLQNIEAANYIINKIAPKLYQTIPQAKIVIAGQETSKINNKKTVNVEIQEIEPENSNYVKNLYQTSTIFIAPIFGPGGTRLKILAAMAAGLPVVSTKTGVEGLDVKENQHILIAETPEEFVDQIESILSNRTLYNQIRKNAFILAKNNYNWAYITKNLELIYQNIIKNYESRN